MVSQICLNHPLANLMSLVSASEAQREMEPLLVSAIHTLKSMVTPALMCKWGGLGPVCGGGRHRALSPS